MSLHIYMTEEEIPEHLTYIHESSGFFDLFVSLDGSAVEQTLLEGIEGVSYNSAYSVKDDKVYKVDALSKLMLSTSTKVMLNILHCPEYCFNLAECGGLALSFLPKLTTGHAYLGCVPLKYTGTDIECDIICKGKHYTNMHEFVQAVNQNVPEVSKITSIAFEVHKCVGGITYDVLIDKSVAIFSDDKQWGKDYVFTLIQACSMSSDFSCIRITHKMISHDSNIIGLIDLCRGVDIVILDDADLYLTPDTYNTIRGNCSLLVVYKKSLQGYDLRGVGQYKVDFDGSSCVVQELKSETHEVKLTCSL